ncbi:MAG: pseudouridine synthase [Lachnospiraceae bacterium]|nr:pseudouridine synthase [Lachnospiraceae bacterium]
MQKVRDDFAEAENGVRLNKYMSDSGYCSRREADRLIAEGVVTINGSPAGLGDRVFPWQTVSVRGKVLSSENELIFLVVNKPAGIECTTDRSNPDNIVDFIGLKKRIYPVGRLDKNSRGLIFMTNDGSLVNPILKASNYHEKEYLVEINQEVTDDFLKAMASGIWLPELKVRTRKCEVEKTGKNTFRIVLTQGLNRQIRRMCQALNVKVLDLQRIRIMNITLGRLKEGEYRNIRKDELKELTAAAR